MTTAGIEEPSLDIRNRNGTGSDFHGMWLYVSGIMLIVPWYMWTKKAKLFERSTHDPRGFLVSKRFGDVPSREVAMR